MQRFRRDFTRTIPVQTPLQLEVSSRNGRTAVYGEERAAVSLRVALEMLAADEDEARDLASRVEAGIRAEGDRLRLEAPELSAPQFGLSGLGIPLLGLAVGLGSRLKVDYELRVPRQTSVRVDARDGSIELRGLAGPAVVEARNGRVEVEDVDGSAQVRAPNGRITLRRCRGQVEAHGDNGHIVVEETGGEVRVSNSNGPLMLSDAGSGLRASTSNGPITYRGRVEGDFDLKTTNGPIRLRVPADSRFELDAESDGGFVACDLAVKEGVQAEGRAPTVRLRTSNGGIRIERL